MQVGVLKESGDSRVAMVPATAKKMIAAGYQVCIEQGAGEGAYFTDAAYEEAGCTVAPRDKVLAQAEMLLAIGAPPLAELQQLKPETAVLAMFNPLIDKELAAAVAKLAIWPFSLDRVPRTSIAQSMDILSSQASLAGYKAVLEAAYRLPSYFPMLMTAAGTIPPAKVLILGAGVAGLQAIATARRLGATVEAFDVRSAVKEEVQSLGAKFVEVEGAVEDAAAGGYAVEQSDEYKQRQKQLIHERAARADVIITTANIPGRQAPLLIEAATVEAMKPGSVIVDLAAATGGNCAFTQNDQVVVHQGVTIVGNSNLPGDMPRDSSVLYSNNVLNFVKYVFKDGKNGVDFANEVVTGTWIGAPRPQPAAQN